MSAGFYYFFYWKINLWFLFYHRVIDATLLLVCALYVRIKHLRPWLNIKRFLYQRSHLIIGLGSSDIKACLWDYGRLLKERVIFPRTPCGEKRPLRPRWCSAGSARMCVICGERGDTAVWHCTTERNRPSSGLWPAQLAWHTFLRAAGHSGLCPLTSAALFPEGATLTRRAIFLKGPFKSQHYATRATVGHDCGWGCGGVYSPEGDCL